MKVEEKIYYYKDGSIQAKGATLNGQMHGHWEFFRKDGTLLRSGNCEYDKQVGEWTTYDKEGKMYKVTKVKAK
ncbi:MAG: hypothetical protein KF746_19375 [Chitinophagaceae bacterium]|nr:hypothetical protein [Chitinophagaceae bacterium]